MLSILKSVGLVVGIATAGALGTLTAQGIGSTSEAVVLHGSTSNTSHPATIDTKRVEESTAEYQTIKAEGVRRGSARYEILVAKMHQRIKEACRQAAAAEGCDCVVRAGDITDARGLTVTDLTTKVIAKLEAAGNSP